MKSFIAIGYGDLFKLNAICNNINLNAMCKLIGANYLKNISKISFHSTHNRNTDIGHYAGLPKG